MWHQSSTRMTMTYMTVTTVCYWLTAVSLPGCSVTLSCSGGVATPVGAVTVAGDSPAKLRLSLALGLAGFVKP